MQHPVGEASPRSERIGEPDDYEEEEKQGLLAENRAPEGQQEEIELAQPRRQQREQNILELREMLRNDILSPLPNSMSDEEKRIQYGKFLKKATILNDVDAVRELCKHTLFIKDVRQAFLLARIYEHDDITNQLIGVHQYALNPDTPLLKSLFKEYVTLIDSLRRDIKTTKCLIDMQRSIRFSNLNDQQELRQGIAADEERNRISNMQIALYEETVAKLRQSIPANELNQPLNPRPDGCPCCVIS